VQDSALPPCLMNDRAPASSSVSLTHAVVVIASLGTRVFLDEAWDLDELLPCPFFSPRQRPTTEEENVFFVRTTVLFLFPFLQIELCRQTGSLFSSPPPSGAAARDGSLPSTPLSFFPSLLVRRQIRLRSHLSLFSFRFSLIGLSRRIRLVLAFLLLGSRSRLLFSSQYVRYHARHLTGESLPLLLPSTQKR